LKMIKKAKISRVRVPLVTTKQRDIMFNKIVVDKSCRGYLLRRDVGS
jgi:hypothetical protein